MATNGALERRLAAIEAKLAAIDAVRPVRGSSGSKGSKGDPGPRGLPGDSALLMASAASPLSGQISAAAGKSIVFRPGTYSLDANVADTTTRLVLQHGAVIEVPANRTLGSGIDWQGGQIKPANGIAVTISGRHNLPPNHHAFDISAGGTVQIKAGALASVTPENFGAKNDDATDDTLAVRAAFAAVEWDAASARAMRVDMLPGLGYLVGGTQETVTVDWGGTDHFEHVCLRTTKSGICVNFIGYASIHYKPTSLGSGALHRYFLWRVEGASPIQDFSLTGKCLLRAGNSIDEAKCMLDLHDIRHSRIDNLLINNVPHTGLDCWGLRCRGRDANVVHKLQTSGTLDGYPVLWDYNDDETVARDANGLPTTLRSDADDPSLQDNKDMDHWLWASLDLGSAGNGKKAAILGVPGVVIRQVKIIELAAVRGAGVVIVDRLDSGGVPFAGADVAPRRASNHLEIGLGRTEGILTGTGFPSIRIERHQNGRLRDLSIAAYQLGEGRDARRFETTGSGSKTGVVWDGLVATGVERLRIAGDVRYGGSGTPITVDDDCQIEWGRNGDGRIVSQMVPGDRNRLMPEVAAHWDFILKYIAPNILVPQHWWLMDQTNSANPIEDMQTSGTDYDLTYGGDPTLAQLIDGWHYYTVRFDNIANQRTKMHGNADTPGSDTDPATTSVALLGSWTLDESWTPDGGVAGGVSDLLNLGGTNKGALLRVDPAGSGKLFLRANTTDGSLSTEVYNDGQSFVAFLASNRTAGSIKCWLRKFDGTSEIITVTDTTTMDNGVAKGAGAYSAASSSPAGNLHFMAHFNSAEAEQDGYDFFEALGWRAAA